MALSEALEAALFRVLARSSTAFISCFDRERRIVFLNRTLSRTFEELVGRRIEEFAAPAGREGLVAAAEAAFESGEPQRYEFQAVLASGEELALGVQVVPFKGPNGEPLALQLSSDLTENRRLALALDQSEEFRRRVVENLPDYVVLLDRDRRFQWVNRLAPGLAEADVVGAVLDDFVSEETLPVTRAAIEHVFSTGTPAQYEVESVVESQRTWFSTRVVPVMTNGEVRRVLALTSVITERKLAEASLKRSEARFRALAEYSPDHIAVITPGHVCEYANRGVAGRPAETMVGQKLEEFTPPEDLEAARAALASVFGSGVPADYETTASGDVVFRVRVVPFGAEDEQARALMVSTDITRVRKDEAARRDLLTQLHQAQRLESIGMLAGGIAHDFNNLLQVIQSNLHFARESLDHPQVAAAELEEALRATQRAAELTRHLLAVGRRQHLEPKCADLGTLVKNSVRMIRRVMPASIEIHCEAGEGCFALVDGPEIEQVLLNLCLNARDAMPSGGNLRISVGGDPDDDATCLLAVSDDGVGIERALIPRLFEPFFTTKASGTGSGLGLAVAAGIVHAHGGIITVNSALGRGSTFSVRLPRAREEAGGRTPSEHASARGNELVLVAEDEPLVRAQVARVLTSAGYRVLCAENGEEAVELFARERGRVGLVFLDVVMPKLDGWQAFLRIAEMERGVRVLFTSGYSADALPPDFDGLGIRLLSKPYAPAALLDAVRETLDAPPRMPRSA
jgi:two-component system cell cycle sensor histidine kinase/response regulator CckA